METVAGAEAALNELPETEKAPPVHPALTPPNSGHEMEDIGGSSSDLSDAEPDTQNVEEEIKPDHYWDGGKIPVFKPTMDQFRDFEKFVNKVDQYGMQSGIVKIIPPKEWRDSLPALDEAVKSIRIKNPITQEFSGTQGCYTQANIEKQRSYNLPQWKALTHQSFNLPPARRGERRRAEDVTPRPKAPRSATKSANTTPDGPRRRGRPPKKKPVPARPITPELEESPVKREGGDSVESPEMAQKSQPTSAIKEEAFEEPGQVRSVTSRRKQNKKAEANEIDETAFKGFDYRMSGLEEFTPERCKELETVYWKTVLSGLPMYGADMAGSLFTDATKHWNVANLPNLLDVLGTKVPGVNSTYCYFGMWKATFAWHVEDVDLYSINYIHFGAPKQWYSISQADLPRFEKAMRSKWPMDAKNCSQFMRHKTYLISPSLLESQFGIKVNRLVHYEGEFVITYPYGYHSGFNLGYNCAESVNFATEAWLDYAKTAKKCDCVGDSVWVDVYEIERKLRGEPTPEYYETDVEDNGFDGETNLPSPDSNRGGKAKSKPGRKRKRESGVDEAAPKLKRIKIIKRTGPCCLCPNDVVFDKLLKTDNGKQAHQLCALYTPETLIVTTKGGKKVQGVEDIDKARLGLKCNFCHQKFGACFQCSTKKCTRSYHATCAAEAGVQVDEGPVPAFDEDGTEYYYDGFDFRCRFHRPRRAKNVTVEALEENIHVKELARSLRPKDVVQAQLLSGDIFCGIVVENRPTELCVVVDVLPARTKTEVEWKYLLALDPADSLRPKPSASAIPLPSHLTNNQQLNARHKDGPPEIDSPFLDPDAPQKWAEFNACSDITFHPLATVDLEKQNQVWFYLGASSTEAKAQYTEDPENPRYNPNGNFLEIVKPPPNPAPKKTTGEQRRKPRVAASQQPTPQAIEMLQRLSDQTQQTLNRLAQMPRLLPQPPRLLAASPASSSANIRPKSADMSNESHAHVSPHTAQLSPANSSGHHSHTLPKSSLYHTPGQTTGNSREPSGKASQQHSQNTSMIVRHDYVVFIQRFPYLVNAYLRRPKSYVSPYAGENFNSESEVVRTCLNTMRTGYQSASSTPHGANMVQPHGSTSHAHPTPSVTTSAVGHSSRLPPLAPLAPANTLRTGFVSELGPTGNEPPSLHQHLQGPSNSYHSHSQNHSKPQNTYPAAAVHSHPTLQTHAGALANVLNPSSSPVHPDAVPKV